MKGDTYYIVEAKGGPKAREIGREAVPAEVITHAGHTYNAHAMQGSRKYLEVTLADMAKDGRPTKEIAEKLLEALRAGKVKYINVKTVPKGPGKATFSVKHYKI